MKRPDLKNFLEEKVREYNTLAFIDNDPVAIPHLFTKKQDIEISGLWAAILAWGQRKTIIAKCRELFNLMDMQPYDFVLNCSDHELKPLVKFKHRTFNATDTLYFIEFFRHYYNHHDSLEDIFLEYEEIEKGLINFHDCFFSLPDYPGRTRKHIPTPAKNSACKRMNMFLRWMVRKDKNGVDFGIWKRIDPSQLICPCDLHVDRVGRRLGLITRKQTDWKTALELTKNLRTMDPEDPVKYDYALFGLGVVEKF